jgi:8-amino-7-oxononanoate synthase
LRNRASTWIYTTGLSPADTAAALEAIRIVKIERDRCQQLWNNINLLKQQLSELNLLPSESPIICLGLDTPTQALNLAKKLNENGIFAPAIRPPTVPTSRIRFSVMATHKSSHIHRLGEEAIAFKSRKSEVVGEARLKDVSRK